VQAPAPRQAGIDAIGEPVEKALLRAKARHDAGAIGDAPVALPGQWRSPRYWPKFRRRATRPSRRASRSSMRDRWTSSQMAIWVRVSHRDLQSKLAAVASGIQSVIQSVGPSKASPSPLIAPGIVSPAAALPPIGRRSTAEIRRSGPSTATSPAGCPKVAMPRGSQYGAARVASRCPGA
jgi:hypothetical protein